MYIYIADFTDDQPSIIYARVVKETDKQYQIDEAHPVLGSATVPTRISKDKYACFPTELEATRFLIQQIGDAILCYSQQAHYLRKEINRLQFNAKDLQRAEQEIAELHEEVYA